MDGLAFTFSFSLPFVCPNGVVGLEGTFKVECGWDLEDNLGVTN